MDARPVVDTSSEQYAANRAGAARAPRRARGAARPRSGRRRRALRRPPPGAGQAHRPRAHRAAARPRARRSSSSRRWRRGAPSSTSARASSPASAWSSGVECVIIAHDPTVRGGSMNPYTLQEEPAGARDRPRQPAAGGQPRRVGRRRPAHPGRPVRARGPDLPRPHRAVGAGASRPIALVFGNSTAGGAYVPGMCDYAVLVDQRRQGVPRRSAAREDGDRRGVRRRGARRRGDALARLRSRPTTSPRDELDCIRIGREIVADLNWRKLGPGPSRPADEPLHDPEELLGIASVDLRVPFDPREVIARVVDGSRFDEYKARVRHQPRHRLGVDPRLPRRHPRQRPAACCSWTRRRRRPSSSCSPTRPTRRSCSSRTPPATWSGRSTSRRGSSRTAPR